MNCTLAPMSIGDRVRTRRKELKLTQVALAKAVTREGHKTTQQAIQMLEGGHVDRPLGTHELARVLGLNERWLLSGKGERLVGGGVGHVLTRFSVIGTVQAGLFQEALEWPEDDWREGFMPYAPKRFPHAPRWGLDVRGPSMDRDYPDGSVVVFVRWADVGFLEPEHGDHLVVTRRSATGSGKEATLKEYRIHDDGSKWLWPKSSDPNFQQPWPVKSLATADEEDGIGIVGVVVASYQERG